MFRYNTRNKNSKFNINRLSKMNDFKWGTEENRLEGLIEWRTDLPNTSFSPKLVLPKKCNAMILNYFREQNLTQKKILYHGSPLRFKILKPQHDFYGQRRFAAISCTIDPCLAIAFGLINRNIKHSKEVVLYKLNEEAVLSEFQIGNRNASIAYDVLYDVRKFCCQVFRVENYDYEHDYEWMFNTLKWEIDEDRRKKLIERIKLYLEDANHICTP